MVDSALERPDVALSKRGTIWLNRVPLRALRSFFLTQNRVAGPVSFNAYFREIFPGPLTSFLLPFNFILLRSQFKS